ncbi:MAG: methionine--tRNA ligase [Candidatus Obscuribacterales bacterium]|nr:methionine--tRNA ligase [Candidatus Obscuribacterales bacterium]
MNKNIFIGAAWPYGNGSLHLGHIAALVGSDVLARYHRAKGDRVLFVSGTDCHGTPITVRAEKEGVDPAEIASRYHEEFRKTLIDQLNFSFDIYSATSSDLHKRVVQKFFLELVERKLLVPSLQSLPYCAKCVRFVPDRLLLGTCPGCRSKLAKGDQCDDCTATFTSEELVNPYCKVCGSKPEWKTSEHYFLRLSALQSEVAEWIAASSAQWRPNAIATALKFAKEGFEDRAVTRDLQWGVEVPVPGFEKKRIYVWFEAVLGYISASMQYGQSIGQPELWKEFWCNDSSQHSYFHGKDNVFFHTVIWPAILIGLGNLHLPDRILSTEYLLSGEAKFSKSSTNGIDGATALQLFPADVLRYFLLAYGPEQSDTEFSLKRVAEILDVDLIGKFGNLVNRVASLARRHFADGLPYPVSLSDAQSALINEAESSFNDVGRHVEAGNFKKSIRVFLELVQSTNRFLTVQQPWKTVTSDRAQAGNDLAVAIQVVRALTIIAEPFIPTSAAYLGPLVGLEKLDWEYPAPIDQLVVGEIKPLFSKVSL